MAYLDPPYNQHRYFTNYHIWETLVAWDAPEHYGVACKRVDARDESPRASSTPSARCRQRSGRWSRGVRSRVLILSYNDEAWVTREDLERDVLATTSTSHRWPSTPSATWGPRSASTTRAGEKVGTVSHLHNVEYVVVAGPEDDVRRVVASVAVEYPPEAAPVRAVSSTGGPG